MLRSSAFLAVALSLALAIVLAPAAFAQEGAPADPSVWVDILSFVVGASGITIIAQALLSLSVAGVIPGWLKPLIGPLFGVLASLLSPIVGFVPDFGPIVGVLMGTMAANLFDFAKAAKLLQSTG